jgi:hypothetical protein
MNENQRVEADETYEPPAVVDVGSVASLTGDADSASQDDGSDG